MAKKKVFYSFHFSNDVFRTQQIRNIGAIEGNQPVNPNEWEEVKRKGEASIKNWIDSNMRYKDCVVVLVGSETANRPWVKYEIEKAWKDGRGLMGIYIHNIKCMKNGTCSKGPNPFDGIQMSNGKRMSAYVDCYDPSPLHAYNDIANNIETWIDVAIKRRGK
jgi:hypothetical protein